MLTIALPYLPPKEFNPNSRVHWSQRYRAGQKVKDDVMALVLEQGWQGDALEKAKVKITWTFPDKRRRDLDNLLSATKPCLDSLVLAGVIQDDSMNHITLELAWQQGKKAETMIEVSAPEETKGVISERGDPE